jgi:hypothetical protein
MLVSFDRENVFLLNGHITNINSTRKPWKVLFFESTAITDLIGQALTNQILRQFDRAHISLTNGENRRSLERAYQNLLMNDPNTVYLKRMVVFFLV